MLAHRIASLAAREPDKAEAAPAGALDYLSRLYYDTGLANNELPYRAARDAAPARPHRLRHGLAVLARCPTSRAIRLPVSVPRDRERDALEPATSGRWSPASRADAPRRSARHARCARRRRADRGGAAGLSAPARGVACGGQDHSVRPRRRDLEHRPARPVGGRRGGGQATAGPVAGRRRVELRPGPCVRRARLHGYPRRPPARERARGGVLGRRAVRLRHDAGAPRRRGLARRARCRPRGARAHAAGGSAARSPARLDRRQRRGSPSASRTRCR